MEEGENRIWGSQFAVCHEDHLFSRMLMLVCCKESAICIYYYHGGMWSFIHLIKIIKAFFGGQLCGKQFRGCQEAQLTISACDIVGK